MTEPRQHHWQRLLAWYGGYRNDHWEHEHGIKLMPLEHKPGWSLIVDTHGTEMEGITMVEQRLARSETDWLHWAFETKSFRATGGERNVPDMIEKLFNEIERVTDVYKRT